MTHHPARCRAYALNMIVKNEMVNLPRALKSVLGHVTAAVIYDTGSIDTTVDYCRTFFSDHDIPVVVAHGVFKNFEQARNAGLIHARKFKPYLWDYLLLMDADMELVADKPLPPLVADCYALVQRQGSLAYHNARLLSQRSKALYHGVTHEYLDTMQMPLPGDAWWFKDHASGSNRPEKYERDIRLLTEYLEKHPDDARSLFYLAQTYRDKGENEKAIEFYKKRIAAGGWEEEVWYSKLCLARCYRALDNEAEFIRCALDAYNERPIRSEPLYMLARHFREKPRDQNTAWLFAEAGDKISRPNDFLFVEEAPYQWGFREEKAILGAYNDKTKPIGAAECDKLSLMIDVPPEVRETARRNLYWYLEPLKNHAPSFQAVKIPPINPDSTYTNSNPSVAVVDGKIKAVVRTVSYRIRPDGSYDYNGVSAIRTTSYLADFDPALKFTKAVELQRPTGFPEPVFKDVLDVEDMRLWVDHQDQLWVNGCVLEQNPQAWREQFIMRLNEDTGEVDKWRMVEPGFVPKQNEKNWMPIVGEGALFMYRPGVTMDGMGYLVTNNPPSLAVDQFAGGGQVLPFDGGWLAIIHEARPDPTNGKRFYQHRFVWFDHDFVLKKVSRPFVFFDRQIEFAAGLALHPDLDKFIVSFGVLDREAWLGTISDHDVREFSLALINKENGLCL